MPWKGNEDAGDLEMMSDADASEFGLVRAQFCQYTGDLNEKCTCGIAHPAAPPKARWKNDPIALAERAFGA